MNFRAPLYLPPPPPPPSLLVFEKNSDASPPSIKIPPLYEATESIVAWFKKTICFHSRERLFLSKNHRIFSST